MQILSLIEKHQVKFTHSFEFLYYNDRKKITINDQEDACKNPWLAYAFAKLNIPGTDIKKCQEAACKDPLHAYVFATHIPSADLEYCCRYFNL